MGFVRSRTSDRLTYTTPTLTANADVAASIDPTIQVSLDGGGHANLNLSAGLDLNADTTKNPGGISPRQSRSPETSTSPSSGSPAVLSIYQHNFDLLHANGPFSTSGNGSGGGAGSGTGGSAGGDDTVMPVGPTSGPSGLGVTVVTSPCPGGVYLTNFGPYQQQDISPLTNATVTVVTTYGIPQAPTA